MSLSPDELDGNICHTCVNVCKATHLRKSCTLYEDARARQGNPVKQSSEVKEEKPCEHNWGTLYCMKCGVPNVDGISDTITIPRSVAEEWVRWVCEQDRRHKEDNKIIKAIKSALGGR